MLDVPLPRLTKELNTDLSVQMVIVGLMVAIDNIKTLALSVYMAGQPRLMYSNGIVCFSVTQSTRRMCLVHP